MPDQDRIGALRSERMALAAILTMVHAARRHLDRVAKEGVGARDVLAALETIEQEARALMEQVVAGHHINPPVWVLSNPPLKRPMQFSRGESYRVDLDVVGVIGREMHEIRYIHADDGHPYRHPFERNGTSMYAAIWGNRRVVLLSNPRHDLWGEF